MRQELRKKNGRHLSIFIVILWVNILSIVVVSGFNYFVFHRMSNDAYLESFILYNRDSTEMDFRNIDSQIIQPVLHIPPMYFSSVQENEPLLRLQEGDVSHRDIREFAMEMKRLQNSYPFVKSVDIYYEATGIAVTGFSSVHYPESEERLHQYLPWYPVWKEENKTQGFIEKPAGAYLTDEPVITYVKKVSIPKWEGKSIILGIHISPDSFGAYINEDEGGLAVLTSNGHMLYDTASYGEPQLSAEAILAHAEHAGIRLEDDGAPVTLELSGNHFTVFQTDSSVSGLRYLYRIENSRFYEEYDMTKQMFLMNFVISIGFNLLLLALISYYNYRTYRKRVLTASKEAGLLRAEEKSSFNGSLNMLTKEISILHKTIYTSKGLLFQREVRSLLFNKNPEAAYETLHSYLIGSHVCTFFLYLSEEDDRRLSVEQLQEAYAPGMRKYNVLFTTVEKISLVAVLLCNGEKIKEAELEFLDDIKRRWNKCKIVSGLMLPVQNDGFYESYNSVSEASKYCYILTQEMRITYELLQIEKRKNSGSHMRLFELMERDIKNDNIRDFKSRLEGLIVSFKSGSYTIDYCNSTLRDLVTLLYRIMQYNQMNMSVLFGYDIREYYKQIPNIDEFHAWSSFLGETIIQNIRQKQKSVDMDIKDKIMTFIEENLEKGITLDALANHLNMRQDVASRVFRQTMGWSYTDYMKERKFNRAIELMEEGRSIKDIAEILGYSTSQYFIKVFREHYGITPHQYKKSRENKREIK